MSAPAAPPARGSLIFKVEDADVFYFAGHLTLREAKTLSQQEGVVGFCAELASHRKCRVFRPEYPGLDWAVGHGWREAVTEEELAREDLVDATRVWVREAWMTRGRRVVLEP